MGLGRVGVKSRGCRNLCLGAPSPFWALSPTPAECGTELPRRARPTDPEGRTSLEKQQEFRFPWPGRSPPGPRLPSLPWSSAA